MFLRYCQARKPEWKAITEFLPVLMLIKYLKWAIGSMVMKMQTAAEKEYPLKETGCTLAKIRNKGYSKDFITDFTGLFMN